MRKKIVAGLSLALIAGLALSGCSSRGSSDDAGSGSSTTIKKGDLIGVALPAKTSQNWVLAGAAFKKSIEDAGFKADIQYANAGNPVPDQQSQISGMITKGAKAVIIGAADGSQLTAQVKSAKSSGAVVIAWDRNILNTTNVDYYVAFNNFKVGQLQAEALLKGLKEKKGDGPYNVELFAGSADDANATVFFNGAMDVLQPKIDDGTIKIVSGQTTFQKVQTKGWLAQNAQSRMTDLLSQYYSGSTKLDGVLSPNDTLARAILTATKAAGKENPVVTGQDSETASIPLIMQGTQYSTIYKNTTEEAQAAIDLVSDLADGKTPKTTKDKNNDNGKKIVPAVELTPILVTKDNAVEAYKGNDALEELAKKG
ncbi:monosaccharide ABC transporter substrate-binding protein (CUT2 family) [Curtobacterium sp. PhB172]|uniref:substrate-binding domain-containing protein n=1 Tax=unclassified Curtobacterium TaxID=257496 RepID=UPI000F46FC2D|nr:MULTISPECIES: sugar-binding protein [unclassified Curtobacterium]ROQ17772.1 monosaccharide ABC transporter substrate-binding protein (CUT2 family) [Curtobacterium sp. PhB171]ROQ28983.1 monosaccharide ABC transporter substrate-binding protein (CUT2 family) [Curtobacterium sp. PhB170]ROS45873.1 monosaccharide ABC transporter substrate-binding protein (CUT2 family) [Curtobacterium sp. PhB131]ROS65426.1 monosaccharide ABC transporter substrate-binding protein (CUT2 family) [Curtobacterium sp. Ph